jgi:hypothetical protein
MRSLFPFLLLFLCLCEGKKVCFEVADCSKVKKVTSSSKASSSSSLDVSVQRNRPKKGEQVDSIVQTTMTAWSIFPVESWCSIIGEMKRYELKDYLWSYVRIFMSIQDAQMDPSIRASSIRAAIKLVAEKWLESVNLLNIPESYFEHRDDCRFALKVKCSLRPLKKISQQQILTICTVFDYRHLLEFITLYYRDILRISNNHEKFVTHRDNLKHFLETWIEICRTHPDYFFKRIINPKIDFIKIDCLLFKYFVKYREHAMSEDPQEILKTTAAQKKIVKLLLEGQEPDNSFRWPIVLIVIIGMLLICVCAYFCLNGFIASLL